MSDSFLKRKNNILQKFRDANQFKIIFICSGNIIRSPYAHLLFESMIANDEVLRKIIQIESGALIYHNDLISRKTRSELIKEGVPLALINQFKPRHYSEYLDMFDSVDLILAMSKAHLERIPKKYIEKSFLLLEFTDGISQNVPDPYFDPPYSHAFGLIKNSLFNLYAMLKTIKYA